MRWRYIDNQSQTEVLYRKRVLDQIDGWWQSFDKRAREFEAHIRGRRPLPIDELATWVDDGLNKINENLLWELWPGEDDRCLFIITPELDHYKRPLVRTIVEMAPELSGWQFLPSRPALTVDVLESIFESRTGLSIPETKVSCQRSNRNVVNVTFFSDSFSGENDREDIETAYCLCEYLLGEETLNKWVGNIATRVINTSAGRIVQMFDRDKQSDISNTNTLSEFAQAVDKVVLEIRMQIDDQPLRLQTLVEASPVNIKEESAPSRRRNFVSSKHDIIESVVMNGIFYSERFSRHGEYFCCLKIDDENHMSFADFAALRDAVDSKLRAAAVGCVFGYGTSSGDESASLYIDLSLENIDKGIEVLREVAAQQNLPVNSWLLFFDTELEQEWVGLYPETVAP
jgi:hypothetical protein